MIPAAVLALVVFVISIPFLRLLPIPSRNGLIVSAALLLSGALGIEMIGGVVSLHARR